MDNEGIKKYLKENNYCKLHKIRFYPEVENSILKATQFLDKLKYKNKTLFNMRLQCILDDITEIPKCKFCNENLVSSTQTEKSIFPYKVRFNEYCGYSCMQKDKTGKRIQTVQERYGVDNVFQDKNIIEKSEQTRLEKYGARYMQQTPEFWENYRKVIKERYGAEHYFNSKEYLENFQEDFKKERSQHFSEELKAALIDNEKMLQLYQEHKTIRQLAEYLGCQQSYMSKHFIENDLPYESMGLNPYIGVSKIEEEVSAILESFDVEYKKNDRTLIQPFEIDFLIESHKLAIELNGNYWHSDIFKERKYHQNKSLKILEMGYKVLHIWEDDLFNKPELIKNKIKHLLGMQERVYARKCLINTNPNTEIVRNFLNENHIQGFKKSSKHLALEYKGEIVQVLSVSNTKKTPNDFSIERYQTSKSVVGGFSKLLKYVKNDLKAEVIKTYASLEYGSGGNMYEKCGFKNVGLSVPNYFYVKNFKRYSRQEFQKHKLKDFENYTEDLTEKEIVKNAGFLLNNDSGSFKYEWRKI